MIKYQFHIAFHDKGNTAASKAVQDCKSILTGLGYRDLGIDDITLTDKLYRFKLLVRVAKFFLTLSAHDVVAVQYPLPSGNNLFQFFMKAARLKKVKFFCIVHDLEDLRYGEYNAQSAKDIQQLSAYDCVIVHNAAMKEWLSCNSLTVPMVTLGAFDYLAIFGQQTNGPVSETGMKKIAFAGNLSKSRFIYALDLIKSWDFNLYGPHYLPEEAHAINNICWNGTLSPEEIIASLKGAFGLIWDGEYVDRLDNAYGNYLKFNYPHKMSLYLAAGLPVIAPRNAAVSDFIKENNIGILVDDLTELNDIAVNADQYRRLQKNAREIGEKIKRGGFFTDAIIAAEAIINFQKVSQLNVLPENALKEIAS